MPSARGEAVLNTRRAVNGGVLGVVSRGSVSELDRSILDEDTFQKMLALERKRSERSRKPFLLMLLDMGEHLPSERATRLLKKALSAIALSTRETDITGWYRSGSTVGVMFTEISIDDRAALLSTMMTRVSDTLRSNLSAEQFNGVCISFHLFPEDWEEELPRAGNPTLYPDLTRRDNSRKVFRVIKRLMDIVGSGLALIFLAPIFLLISLSIKLTSAGPVFFRQRRVGQHGVPFTFLKFRSMHVNNDASVHKEYVRRLIAGEAEKHATGAAGGGVYKIAKDSRVTPIGRLLRRTSLDEIPQFLNVLQGSMSLVGPRPPVPYEVEAYDIWHRRRLLEAKPGITGLWQVSGRSKVKFDEMVRLDLRYAKSWSPWTDLKILLRTPLAVVLGDGAF